MYISPRNQHEHSSTKPQLASILLSALLLYTHLKYHWGGELYPFCYGKTVEELADEDEIECTYSTYIRTSVREYEL